MQALLPHLPIYKSPWGRRKILAYYEAALQDCPVPIERLTVDTRYGSTHILSAGPRNAPVLLLLHGLGDTALLWRPFFAELSQKYRLYAPDILGQPGNSAPVRLSYQGTTYGQWLRDILDKLAVASAGVIGLSLGGFSALCMALAAPERVNKIILLGPAGIVPVKLASLIRMLPVGLFPSRANCRRFMERGGAPVTDQALDWACLISKYFIPAPPPRVFGAGELQRVSAPLWLLVGQQDLFFDGEKMVRRARQRLPYLMTANIVPGAGHNLVRERADIVQTLALSVFGA